MSAQAREGKGGIETIPALGIGTLQEIAAVAASKTIIFFDIGVNPDASGGNRIPMAIDAGMYWRCDPGDKVAAHDGTSGGTITNPVGANTTVVYLYYDSTAGTAYVLECD